MALSYGRFLYRVGQSSCRAPVLVAYSKRFASSEEGAGKPYRPWPCEEYRYQGAFDYWNAKGYVPQSAQADVENYKPEELHLSEIEKRLERYGKKYSHSERLKALWNEYGWQDDDDRPYSVYGSAWRMSEHEEEKWGPGKKITPTHYMHSSPQPTTRQPIPPVQYMHGEQIRRVRGRLARFREWPQEVPSIWKSWNPYVTVAAITGIGVCKELFFYNSHDFKELFFIWAMWSAFISIGFDTAVWFFTGKFQEDYDRQFLPLQDSVERSHEMLEKMNSVPVFKNVFAEIVAYRKDLGERVLKRTTANRVQSYLDATVAKLEAKMVEERSSEAVLTSKIKTEALNATLKYFDDPKVRQDFTAMVVKNFSAGDAAKLVTGAANQVTDTGVFKKQYDASLQTAQKNVHAEARQKGTLPWVVRSEDEKAKAKMSPEDKNKEFKARVEAWAASRNPVPNAALA